ncbi:MAG: hypothetical protein HYU41_10715 [Candidatus Rokubacteria bacterium]|nr:hypothetical protein [Candidatus Rokubacteria bacterium]
MDLDAELRRITEALDGGGVRYALAGGLAVAIYATPRATEDVDLLVAGADLDAAIAAITGLGFRAAGPPMDVARGRLRIHRLLKFEQQDLLLVDLLVPQDQDLGRLLDERSFVDWQGQRIAVVSIDGLSALKRLLGTAQDRADVDSLAPVRGMPDRDVGAALRAASVLRRLCLSLPHLATPSEARLLARFHQLTTAPEGVTTGDIDALAAGWRTWWRAGRVAELSAMAERVTRAVIDSDRRLATYAVAAQAARTDAATRGGAA